MSLSAICLALLLGFLWVSHVIHGGNNHDLDHVISAWMRYPADPALLRGPEWLPNVVRDISSLGSFPVLLLVAGCSAIYLFVNRMHRQGVFFLLTVVCASLLSSILKSFFNRARPDIYDPLVQTFSSSFPSAHAMMSAAVYLGLGVLVARLHHRTALRIFAVIVAILLTVLIGVSRIYLAVHWPSDVLAGWLAGIMCVLFFYIVEMSLSFRMKNGAKGNDPA